MSFDNSQITTDGIEFSRLCDASAAAEQQYRAAPTMANLQAAITAACNVHLAVRRTEKP